MANYQPMTDAAWELLQAFFQEPAKRGRGKPHANWRHVVNAILFVLASGQKWDQVPVQGPFATKSVSHRWFKIWSESGLLEEILAKYTQNIDPSFTPKIPPRRNRLKKKLEAIQESLEDFSAPQALYADALRFT